MIIKGKARRYAMGGKVTKKDIKKAKMRPDDNTAVLSNKHNSTYKRQKAKKGLKIPKYPNGGTIYTTNPNDPRLQAYSDSLTTYHGANNAYLQLMQKSPEWKGLTQKKDKALRNYRKAEKEAEDKYKRGEISKKEYNKIYESSEATKYDNIKAEIKEKEQEDMEAYSLSLSKNEPYAKKGIKPIGEYSLGELGNINKYAAPKQKVKYTNPEVVEKQKKLKEAGLYDGALDGIWGPKSQAAWDQMNKKEEEDTKYTEEDTKLDDGTNMTRLGSTIQGKPSMEKRISKMPDPKVGDKDINGRVWDGEKWVDKLTTEDNTEKEEISTDYVKKVNNNYGPASLFYIDSTGKSIPITDALLKTKYKDKTMKEVNYKRKIPKAKYGMRVKKMNKGTGYYTGVNKASTPINVKRRELGVDKFMTGLGESLALGGAALNLANSTGMLPKPKKAKKGMNLKTRKYKKK